MSFNPVSLLKNLMHMQIYFRIAFFFISIVMVVYTAENSVALRLNMYDR